MTRRLRNAALEAADRGWHVHPLRTRGKQPTTKNGHLDATDDLVTVFKWWEASRHANIGLACEPSGVLAVDVDPRNGGDETFAELERKLGKLPRTISAETGGGGAHYLFQAPTGTLRGTLGPGLDLKSHGYIVLAPSLHPSGRRYEWDEDPTETELARVPEQWLERMYVSNDTRLSRPTRSADPQAHSDPLRQIPAVHYVNKLTGREPNSDGFFQCPLHNGGQERTPSLSCDDHMWACYGACEPTPGNRVAGGNVYDLMARLLDLPLPLRGADYLEVKDRLRKVFSV